MYCKKVLVLQQTDGRFAQSGLELCGMVKLVAQTDATEVTAFVTNAADTGIGQWWLLFNFGGDVVAKQLQTLANVTFSLPAKPLDVVACLLVKRETRCAEVARGWLGDVGLCEKLFRNMDMLTGNNTLAADDAPATNYEQFVAATGNYFANVDLATLKVNADDRYKSVQQYSDAFERFYASGGEQSYYEAVKGAIGNVFVQFPPYYPLIRQYPQSFFVRIDFPSSHKYFVLGVLEQKGDVRYICYGLPMEQTDIADKDFVPVSCHPTSFWMLFQDANTGRIAAMPQKQP